MKFGPSFRQAHAPQWATFYLAYDELKNDLKAGIGSDGQMEGKDHQVVHVKLREQCDRVDFLFNTEHSRLATLHDHVDVVLAGCRPTNEVFAARQHLARTAALYIQKHVHSLLMFAKVNSDAALRILEKLNRITAGLHDVGAFVLAHRFFNVSQPRYFS